MKESAKLSIPVGPQDHIQGDSQAPLTLVEYGDYECPHCARAYLIIPAVQKVLGKKLRFVFRNFPLNEMHPNAELAAEAAEAAGAQGKFWEMHDALYENQESLGPELAITLAEELKLDVPRFAADLESRKFKQKVRDDFMGGVRSGVNGTPTFFVNGERYDGRWDAPELFIAALAAY